MALRKRHLEAVRDHPREVGEAPAHHPVHRDVRPGLDDLHQRRDLPRREPRRPPRPRPVHQPGDPLGVVAMHPVPQRLPVHPAAPRCRRPVRSLHHQRDRQHPPRLSRARRPTRQTPQLRGRRLLPIDLDCHARSLDASTKGNHIQQTMGIPRVRNSGGWYEESPLTLAAPRNPEFRISSRDAARRRRNAPQPGLIPRSFSERRRSSSSTASSTTEIATRRVATARMVGRDLLAQADEHLPGQGLLRGGADEEHDDHLVEGGDEGEERAGDDAGQDERHLHREEGAHRSGAEVGGGAGRGSGRSRPAWR